jgi:long-chain acyl-CoA synthetase
MAGSLVDLFLDNAARLGERPFLWAKRDKAWQSTSWKRAAEDALALAAALSDMGVEPGDRVMLVSESRPEWLIADFAIMAAGGISVPAYTTNTVNDHRHVLSNSGAKAVIVSTAHLAERVLKAAAQVANPPLIVSIEPLPVAQTSLAAKRWDEALAMGAGKAASFPVPRARSDTACLIYTSGTGGAPKGVMLSHGACLHNVRGATLLLEQLGLKDEVFLSFLPLSHSYEHMAGHFFPMSIGAQIYYAEGVDKLADNLVEARPTIMTAVPRLYETMRARILKGVDKAGGLKKLLFLKALAIGAKRIETPDLLSLGDRLLDPILERLVRDKVRARFGGRLKAMVSGGAPLNYDVGLFFTALGVRILQGYGQTESAPVISCNPPERVKLRTVGPAIADTEMRIAEDGEILVKGELVMQGYWGDGASTAAAIQDGWLHTGDIGVIDGDGYLSITDRKKDIIVNSGGDNVSPARIEGLLTLEPEIAQAMAYGDKRPHLVALIVPDAEFAKSWAERHDEEFDLEELCQEPRFRAAIQASLDRVNKGLSPIEKVRRFLLAPDPFTVGNEMMTPTLKIRRHKIRERWGEKLEGLYERG